MGLSALNLNGFRLTEPFPSLADLTDGDLVLDSLDSSLFPNLSPSIQVHQGFANEHAK